MTELAAGSRLAHFEILSVLGAGGMGRVYLARDLSLDRTVALKVLPPGLDADGALRSRLLLEARATARLSHPGIATIHEVGRDQGLDYIAMEHVPGSTLRALLDARKGAGLDPSRAADYARQAAEALDGAHAAGFIHRDIKPENLMVTPDGRVKVLDFGLARRMEGDVTRPRADSRADTATLRGGPHRLTEPGRVAGTVAYMSPEQIRGDPLDPRADIYALGAVLHEMISGSAPFARASPIDTVRAILREPAPPITGAPSATPAAAGLRRIIATALSKRPDDRYASAAEMARDLAALASAPAAVRGARRRAPLVAILSILLLTALAGLSYLATRAVRTGSASAGPQAAGLRVVPLLVRPGDDEDPAVSPGGDRIAFSRDGDLFVLPIAGTEAQGEPRRLTTGDEIDTQPDWSPDGATILFTRGRADGGSEIWKVPAAGGPAARVALSGSTPSWAPDGSRFAFVQKGLGRSSSILTVGADGTWSRPVTRSEDAFFHLYPVWSPDGATIAFVKDAGGGAASDIWLAPSGGGAARQITREPSGIFCTDPGWSADGTWLFYVSNRGGARNLWKIPAAGGEPVRLTTGPGDDAHPRAFNDGRRVLFATRRGQSGLFVRDLATGADRRLLVDSVADLWGPAFSPDGSAVAYTRITGGGEWVLFSVSAQGGAPRQLTRGGAPSVWPRWSPDGTLIAYGTFTKEDDDLFVIPSAGGDPRRLTEGAGEDGWPSWAPDGRSVVFARAQDGLSRIHRVTLSGAAPVLVSEETATLPDVSPDGSLIAVARDRGFWHGVGVMPSSGGPVRWLTDTGGWPVFRPDGRAVTFIRLEPGGRQSLWEAPVGGGAARRLDGPTYRGWNLPVEYSADGRFLVYSNDAEAESDFWVLEMP